MDARPDTWPMQRLEAAGRIDVWLSASRSESFQWSAARIPSWGASRSLGTRTPVGYDSGFVNQLHPEPVQPAGCRPSWPRPVQSGPQPGPSNPREPTRARCSTVAHRPVLVVIEGLKATTELAHPGTLRARPAGGAKLDEGHADKLLNHKSAIEFMVDAVPTEGITVPVIADPGQADEGPPSRHTRHRQHHPRRVVNIDGRSHPSSISSLWTETRTSSSTRFSIRNPG